uniref:Synaptosomal-associated protein 47 n=2 Tax=Chrysotila carterae TaxID=13221 RepID=A0A7S4F1Y9_CHRCT|mmetsp:Transcript_34268/g.75275  ORF Transcript_34268/g.75275 Transcript_34268/m.75275 type:complete len:406 (-) Transcript_34268:215-1432(-)
MEGFLEKNSGGKSKFAIGNVISHWVVRYFVLDGQVLSYYRKPEHKEAAGSLDCTLARVLQLDAINFSICAFDREYKLRAPSAGELQAWFKALAAAGAGVDTSYSFNVALLSAKEGTAVADATCRDRAGQRSGQSFSRKRELQRVQQTGETNPFAESYQEGDLQAVHKEIREKEAEVDAATTRILRTAEDTRQVGAATLAGIHAQGAQLKRIRMGQQVVHSNVKQSDRLLTGMESWFGGAVRSMFRPSRRGDVFASEGRTGSERPFSAAPSIRLDGHTRDPPSRWRQATEGHEGQDRRFGATPTQQPNHDAMEDISRVVADLQAQACQMRDELTAQSGQIDEMVHESEMTASHITVNTRRATRLAGYRSGASGRDAGEDMAQQAMSAARRAAAKSAVAAVRGRMFT